MTDDQTPAEPAPLDARKLRRRKIRRWVLLGQAGLIVILLFAAWLDARVALGARPEGARRARVEASPQWNGERFVDTLPRIDPPMWETSKRWMKGVANSVPTTPVPVVERVAADFATRHAFRVTWFGHSSTLVELDGHRVLLDPVWGERCSPFSFAGPKRWYPPVIGLDELPPIDAVLISHDHYDHLDHPTIVTLAERGTLFVVPLGVGAHLEKWGVPSAQLVELDWWDQTLVGELRVVATPARHFSGRGPGQADQTLWAGWALINGDGSKRVFFSGDTAMFPGFREIGERLGPFDVTLLEVGAYDQAWADVHLGPEQAVAAHQMLGGELLIPVHWGLFDLALHSWTEPIERTWRAADAAGVRIASPRPGESVVPGVAPAAAVPHERWWPEIDWRTADEAPVVSSGLTP